MDFKRVSVIGLGKSGMAAARFFRKHGIEVFASDSGALDGEKTRTLSELGVSYETGGNTKRVLESPVIVVSPGVDVSHPILREARRMKLQVWPEVEAAYRFFPGKLVAVTGTNGKSTVAALVGHLMRAAGRDARAVGNIGLPLLEEIDSMTGDSWAIMEVSSFQLETIVAFRPRIACILNITEDHLNRHPDFQTYARIKARILENQGDGDFAVLNKDDAVVRALAPQVKGKLLWFGDGEIFWKEGRIVFQHEGKTEILAHAENFPLQGKHNHDNLAAAVAICLASGMKQVEKGVDDFKGLPHRLEFVATVNQIDFYDDSKGTNPMASAAALRTFEKPVVLIAGGYDKNLNFTPMAAAAKGRVKALVALGKENSKVLQAFSFLGKDALLESHEMEDAVRKAFSRAGSGDLILLAPACASFDLFHSAEERGEIFKSCVRRLAGERG